MKICSNCESVIENDKLAECPHCGALLGAQTAPEDNQYQRADDRFTQPENRYQQPYNQYQQPNTQYQQPYNQYQQPYNQYQQPYYDAADQVASKKAQTSMILGILSFFVNPVFICSILAISNAKQALASASPANTTAASNAKIGKICGIVSLCINAGVVLLYISAFASGFAASFSNY